MEGPPQSGSLYRKSPGGDAFPEFLSCGPYFPVVFFSFSQSKLPGYILPAVPPITILCGDYLNRIRKREMDVPMVTLHAIVVGILVATALMLPQILVHPHQMPPLRVIVAAIMEGAAVAIAVLVVVMRLGWRAFGRDTGPGGADSCLHAGHPQWRPAGSALFGSHAGPRTAALPDAPHAVAVFQARRDVQFGLAFYLDERVSNYQENGVPAQAHLLVVQDYSNPQEEQQSRADLEKMLAGRNTSRCSCIVPSI